MSHTVKLASLLQQRRSGALGAEDAQASASTLVPVPVPAELDEPPTQEEVEEYAR